MPIDQVTIVILGLLAVWLSQDLRLSVRRWGSVMGLLAQPAWLHAAAAAHQRGAMLMCLVYIVAYLRGIKLGWRRVDE